MKKFLLFLLVVSVVLWSSGAVTVAVSGGVFSVLLGESPQPAISRPHFRSDHAVRRHLGLCPGDDPRRRARDRLRLFRRT